MLCFEAHQNQSLGEGTAQKIVKEQIPSFHAYSSPGILWILEYFCLGPASWKIVFQNNSREEYSVKSTNEVNIP